MKKICKILLASNALLCVVGCSNNDAASYNKNKDNEFLMVDKDIEYYKNLSFKELYEIKEKYYLKNIKSDDNSNENFDVFNNIRIYEYYGSYNFDDSKLVILSLLRKDQGIRGVIEEVILGDYDLKFSGLIPSVYYFKNQELYTLKQAYSLNYLSTEMLEAMKTK